MIPTYISNMPDLYTVSGKKVNYFIHFHNSDKQLWILAKFCSNNATSNCKQNAKFRLNLSTPVIVIGGLVRSPQKQKCPLATRETCDCQSVRLCKYQKHSKSVQNVFHVLECKLEDVDATA